MILDTTFLLDLRHTDPDAVASARDLEASPEPLRVSAITLAELQAGVPRVDNSLAEYTEITDVTASKEIIPVTQSIARRGGRFYGELQNDGITVGLDDCLIAATAIEVEEPVVTRNVDHFDRIDGVLVKEY
ncbi:PIN domain-containing protein [Haladaptatus sp. CMAA 1911]|uniref:PIN domain-containing protein n=1 Tax=unclassified Haladaptatus TaxID=2622732 RepID=UPI003754BF07